MCGFDATEVPSGLAPGDSRLGFDLANRPQRALLVLRFPPTDICTLRSARFANRSSLAARGRGGEGGCGGGSGENASSRHTRGDPPRYKTIAQNRSPVHTKSPCPGRAGPESVAHPQGCGRVYQGRCAWPSSPAAPSNPPAASPKSLAATTCVRLTRTRSDRIGLLVNPHRRQKPIAAHRRPTTPPV